MEVNDDVEALLCRPITDLIQIVEAALGKVLAGRDQGFAHPISDWI